ncbi:MAG: signal peptidase II [Micrococcales bacterium]
MTQPRRWRQTWLALAIASVIVLLDQFVKDLLIAQLEPGRSTPFLGDFIKLYLTYNDSAAFSMGFGQTWIFTLLSSVASLTLLAYLPKLQTPSWMAMAGVALGGIVGNLVDRFTRPPGFGVGQVVDYIQVPLNFPIFNLADTAIVSAAILTVIRIFIGDFIGQRTTKSIKAQAAREASAEAEARAAASGADQQ